MAKFLAQHKTGGFQVELRWKKNSVEMAEDPGRVK